MTSRTGDGSPTSSKKAEISPNEELGLRKPRKSCAKTSNKKSSGSGRKEKPIQNEVTLALSRRGTTVFRNNVGVAYHRDGSVVVYGLCVGSSDLIGFTPVVVTQEMVGRRLAVFTAVECKRERGGGLSPEQRNFLERVLEAGGIAITARSPEDAVQVDEQILEPVSPDRVRGPKSQSVPAQRSAGDPNKAQGRG